MTTLPPALKSFPVSRALCVLCVALPLCASLTATKYVFRHAYTPFLSEYRQWWRVLAVQLAFVNESEAFLACIVLYLLRDLERLYGSARYASVVVVTMCYVMLLLTLLATAQFLTGVSHYLNECASGPTAIVFSLLAHHTEHVPPMYRFELRGPTAAGADALPLTLTLTDHFALFVIALQLALSQGLRSVAMAAVGWLIGDLLVRSVLPGKHWRLPFWHTLSEKQRDSTPLPVLQADADAAEAEAEAEATETRPLASQFLDTFRR